MRTDDEAGRRRRFEAIATEVFEPLQRYLRRRAAPDDADDAFGDVLLVVWRRLDDVPPGAALPWCYGVARRVLANQRRSARRQASLVERIAGSGAATPLGGPEAASLDPRLGSALRRLGEADQEVLRLWAWEHLEPRDIAVTLGISPNAAALRLSRARRRLADQLRRQDRRGAGHIGTRHLGSHS